jgi:hypothetical protein
MFRHAAPPAKNPMAITGTIAPARAAQSQPRLAENDIVRGIMTRLYVGVD